MDNATAKVIDKFAFIVRVVDTIDFYTVIVSDTDEDAIKAASVMWPNSVVSIEDSYNTVIEVKYNEEA